MRKGKIFLFAFTDKVWGRCGFFTGTDLAKKGSAMRRLLTFALLVLFTGIGYAGPVAASEICKIPRGGDADNNGIGDLGVQVVCNYTSVYAYDYAGDWYWDLGDGRVYGTVASIDDLDQTTLSVCDYQVHARGTFENDPFMDSGDISNMIRCYGYDGNATYHYQIVSQDDPRYTGNPNWAVWGTWEYHVLTESGSGNLVHTVIAHLNNPHS